MSLINQWQLLPNRLPQALYAGTFLAYRGWMYAVGGTNGSNLSGIKEIYSAKINTDDTLGLWQLAGTMPGIMGFHAACIHEPSGRLYIYGGTNAPATLYYANVSEGNVGKFQFVDCWAAGFNTACSMLAVNDCILVAEGFTAQIRLCRIDGVSKYTSGSLPVVRGYFQLANYLDNLYIVAGEDGSFNKTTTIYSGKLTNYDIPSWKTLDACVPVAISRAGAVVYNDKLIIVNGRLQSLANTDSVYSAPFNPDGTVGVINTEDRFPLATRQGNNQTVVYNGYIYLLGGFDATYSDKVYYSKLT